MIAMATTPVTWQDVRTRTKTSMAGEAGRYTTTQFLIGFGQERSKVCLKEISKVMISFANWDLWILGDVNAQ